METKTILLIDDEENFRSGAKIALKKKGFHVTDAADGYEGMSHLIRSSAVKSTYSLIVLDIMMPKISGVDILEFMVHKRINTPVLVITGFMNYDIKCFCSRLKKVDILQKPFSSADFFDKINEMLSDEDKNGDNNGKQQ
jgi:DNA-binding NtrC family response regulator